MVDKRNGQISYKMSWKEVEEAIIHIANCTQDSNIDIYNIYGIPRGGSVPAVMLSHYMDKPIVLVEQIGKNTLIVDDIVDSGKTILRYKDKFMTAALCIKKETKTRPDYFLNSYYAEQWVVFPWEVQR